MTPIKVVRNLILNPSFLKTISFEITLVRIILCHFFRQLLIPQLEFHAKRRFMKHIKLYINGEFRLSSDQKSIISTDPCTGENVAMAEIPSKEDLDLAILSAEKALHSDWKKMSQENRSQMILAISEKIKEKKDLFIDFEMKDSGSFLKKAKADIFNTISYFKVLSGVTKNLKLFEKDESASRPNFSTNSRVYSPVGICAQIIPWNFPLVMAAWKLGPVLATGCTTILKSASETPVTAGLLAEVLNEVGVPKGVINIVTGGPEVGEYLVSHPKINKVAFTGSTSVGKNILQKCAPNLKRSTMELGGKSANIILDDADLNIAVDGALYAFLYHQGQACDSGTRLLVHQNIYKEFLEKFLSRIKLIKIGATNDASTGFGPIIGQKQFKSIMNYIDISKKEGAKLLSGGERITGGIFDKGYFIAPTAFEINPKHTIWHEEIFGPVVGITSFSDDEEAIALSNLSHYGLAAAIWSKNAVRAKDMALQLEAGTVWINEYHLLNPGMPFGGLKQSGLGREMGLEGIMSYLEVKHLWESDCNERSQKPWFDMIF